MAGFHSKGWIMCDLCRADENYFHTAECVYDQLVSEYPVMWLRDSTRIGACYTFVNCCRRKGWCWPYRTLSRLRVAASHALQRSH
jgi:hypothetical protein